MLFRIFFEFLSIIAGWGFALVFIITLVNGRTLEAFAWLGASVVAFGLHAISVRSRPPAK